MGLIKAGAIGSTLKDQWKEAIRCEDMNNDVLMVKKTTPTGVISNKSTIIVGPGQCAVIYDNGKVIDARQFGATFKEMWQRFTFNGATSKEQAVFFFNIKEIIDNKFGTASPIPFQDWSHPIPNQMTNTITPLRVQIKCFGKYTFKIINPALFMSEIAGTADIYRKEQLIEQIRTEVMAAFQNVTNELGTEKHKIPVLEMPSQTDEIKQMMEEDVFDSDIRKRGLAIVGFAVESVTLDDESKKKIDNYELSSNAHMQQGRMVDAYANAVEGAANNSNGAMNGFMGIGMMNMASNGMVGGTVNGPWQNTERSSIDLSKQTTEQKDIENKTNQENTSVEEEWKCECGIVNHGRFCVNCGKEKTLKKECPKCKTMNNPTDKFCSQCGESLK